MKKLFALLLMLGGALSSWAYNGLQTGIAFTEDGTTQKIEITTGGSLGAWQVGSASFTGLNKLVIIGPMTASDFSALTGSAWNNFTTVDLSKVTVTDPSYISNMTLANAQTIILPNGLTKAQIESLKNEASGVVAGLVGTSETAYVDHYYYTLLPGETEQEYTGTVSGSEGNYYFHETKTYQRPLTIQDGYPTFTWTDLLGETYDLTKEAVNYNNNNGSFTQSWIPTQVKVPLVRTETTTNTFTYSVTFTYNETEYTVNVDDFWGWYVYPHVSNDFTGNSVTSTGNFSVLIPGVVDQNNNPVSYAVAAGSTINVSIASSTPNVSYTFHHLTRTDEYYINYPVDENNDPEPIFDEDKNIWYGTVTNNSSTATDQYGNQNVNIGEKTFDITSAFKYDYTDIRNNPLQFPAEGTLSAADEDGYVDWVFDENVPLTKVQIPYNNLTDVEGMVANVNTAGSLSNVASAIYDATVLSQYQAAKNITVIGSINNDDLTALNATNFASAEVVNLSGATMAEGSSITNLDSKATALIILPSTPTTQELGQIMAHPVAADNNQYYTCLAYYNGENRLSVFAQDGNVAKIAPFVTTSTAVYSLPHYDTSGNIDYYAGSRGGDLDDYVAAFENIPAAFVDFGYVDVNLDCDFTNLHSNTASIRVPINGIGYDITNKANKSEFAGYTFDNDIKLVSFYVASGVSATINGKGVNTDDTKDKESTNVVMVRESGALDTYHNYLSDEQLHATRQIILTDPNVTGVELTTEDIAELSDCVSDKIDLVDANVSAENVASLVNGTVKYLALPGTGASTINGTYTDVVSGDNVITTVSCDYLEKCPQLICVGALDGTSFTSWSQKNVVNNIQTSSVKKVTDMICVTNYSSVNMSGYLCTDDVSTSTALNGAAVKNAIFTNAIFEPDNQMVFGQGTGTNQSVANAGANWDLNLESIELPTSKSMTTIPANCLSNMQKLTSICIPYNYQNIGNSAFYNDLTLKTITTTDANGKSIDNGENTYTLSSNLLDIDSYAFDTRVPTISDVYVLAQEAPKCDVDAFGNGMVYGWGGFKGNETHPVCRDNYNNNGVLMTMLHFPADATDPEHYTDVTRKYTLMDETGAYDGQGNILYWPLHEEFVQSYNQAMWGVTWENEQGREFGKEANLHQNDGTGTNTYNTEYAGWHQFVLSNYGHSVPTTPQTPTSYYEDDYYTLCFPFDMSKDEVLSILGVKYDAKVNASVDGKSVTADIFPKVYTLKSVTRIGSMITLEFSQDLMALAEEGKTIDVNVVAYDEGYSYGANLTLRESDDEKVYIKGGYPYLVKPILPDGTTISSGLAKYIMSKHVYTKDDLGNKKLISGSTTEYFAAPVDNHKVIATNGQERLTYGKGTPYYYYFQGTYIQMDLPPYAYFLGKKTGETSKRFFRSTSASRKWSAYSSIIGGKCPDNAFIITEGTEGKDEIEGNATYEMTVDNDDFESAGVKYQFTIEGEDGFDEAVNIEKIDGEVVNAAALEGDVFNVAGLRVGTSVEGLSKGLYIVNGKKVLVK